MVKLTNNEYITQIYEETYLYITKYLIVKCRNTDDVSDLLQNVFMNFSARIKKRGQSHVLVPKHYLLRIAKDELSKYYKGKGEEDANILKGSGISQDNDVLINDAAEERIDEKFFLEELAENNIMCDRIWGFIKECDDLTIKIFTLRYMYDMKIPEIAKEMDITLYTVKNKLYRGLSNIRESMKDEIKEQVKYL